MLKLLIFLNNQIMNNPQDIIISFFTHLKANSSVNVSLLDELSRIKTGYYKNLVDKGRELKLISDQQYHDFKQNLPIVTFGGTFSGSHSLTNLECYSNLLVLDIDDLSNSQIALLRQSLVNDEYIFAFWLSPSGNGIKGLIRLGNDISYHKTSFNFFKKYFIEKYNTVLDKSGSNVNRTCFVSYDEDLYLNINSKLFFLENDLIVDDISHQKKLLKSDRKTIKEYNENVFRISFGLNKQNDRNLIINIIKFLKKNNKSITNSHERWYQCAYAISKTFSFEIGCKYYLELCAQDGINYDRVASIEKLRYCYLNKDIDGGVSFSTLIHFAEQEGFKVHRKIYP